MPRSRFSREPPSATLPNNATAPVAARASERSVVVRREESTIGTVTSRSKRSLASLMRASTPRSASGTARTVPNARIAVVGIAADGETA